MDGSEGPRVQSTRAFARNLVRLTDLPITFWDERLSTVAAERALIEADTSRKRRKEVIDQVAAGYILQGALDRMAYMGRDLMDEVWKREEVALALRQDLRRPPRRDALCVGCLRSIDEIAGWSRLLAGGTRPDHGRTCPPAPPALPNAAAARHGAAGPLSLAMSHACD